MKQKWLLAVGQVVKSVEIEQKCFYHNIPGKERSDIRDAWIKVIVRPTLPKA